MDFWAAICDGVAWAPTTATTSSITCILNYFPTSFCVPSQLRKQRDILLKLHELYPFFHFIRTQPYLIFRRISTWFSLIQIKCGFCGGKRGRRRMWGFGGRYYWGRKVAFEKAEGIVVVFAWMSSEEKHLMKYVDLYSSLRWNSLVCHSQFLNMWVLLTSISQ